ncbi:protein translocase subunit SecF [Candidatus Gromoviella agglomerans]|uniref:protein translocase subunit SecF n=1 Tax=Candidatus Gromoviella agglomerans TaxID=2806609 RepID=UPI001E45E7A6|nr:protein translocase subunit SecF [Candidatus Gromoviella agglomerans]UFX98345.1 Protein-export membrane protein SecF [Candidatus Gromoviella agglomerans]
MFWNYLRSSNIDFVKFGRIAMFFSLFLFVLSFFCYFRFNLNYGVDFQSGYLFEIKSNDKNSLHEEDIRQFLESVNVKDCAVYKDNKGKVCFRIASSYDQEFISSIKSKIVNDFDVEFDRFESVGPKLSRDLILNGLLSIIFSLIGIFLYVWVRYKWHFGLAAVIVLLNDMVILFSAFSILRIEFNENGIVAFLVTVSYAINDVVVIFDRVQSNLSFGSDIDIKNLVNNSVNSTLYRTVMTSFTTIVSLIVLYFFGGAVISSFSLPIMIGIFGGTLSSIFLAAPLWMRIYSIKFASS